jgi:hypothetical protein
VQESLPLTAVFKFNRPTYALHPISLLLIYGLFNGAEPAVDIISHAVMADHEFEFGMLDEEAVVNDYPIICQENHHMLFCS